ncbi:hypothetical protein K402DRAFT_418302 [Aulographum hederae CBS 113979]|uniref:Uncharacterized protein n=1 Tax=Aulographum hederae CBS 113979 TaxID=1176131 RepID=A0A6G1H973_9PEZI|nr:hypothetical protein K402DRAFT_418302 [Aulographum hederae CBS 113979]
MYNDITDEEQKKEIERWVILDHLEGKAKSFVDKLPAATRDELELLVVALQAEFTKVRDAKIKDWTEVLEKFAALKQGNLPMLEYIKQARSILKDMNAMHNVSGTGDHSTTVIKKMIGNIAKEQDRKLVTGLYISSGNLAELDAEEAEDLEWEKEQKTQAKKENVDPMDAMVDMFKKVGMYFNSETQNRVDSPLNGQQNGQQNGAQQNGAPQTFGYKGNNFGPNFHKNKLRAWGEAVQHPPPMNTTHQFQNPQFNHQNQFQNGQQFPQNQFPQNQFQQNQFQ